MMDMQCTHNKGINCSDCRMSALCLPIALQGIEIDRLNNIVQRGRPLQKGEYLFRAGEPFKSIYAVRSGTIKSYTANEQGVEQITGFYFPSEILGMDGVGNGTHTNSALALETAATCEIPFSRMEELSVSIPSLQHHLFRLMGQEITNDQHLITLLSKNTAEERVATLLLSVSLRNTRRKLSGTRFRLPMSRADIGNYLGLTVETVSRVFSRFQKQALLRVDKKEVEILDVAKLRTMAAI